jgi:hypothetical protein
MPIRTSPARITTAVRPARSRRWRTSGALIALTTGLGLFAPQGAVALAQSPRPATIGAGNAHSCTIESGKAYCWGDNNQGDLGNNSTTQSSVPVLAGPQAPANVRAVPLTRAARVSWTAPASLDGGALLGYTATARPGGASCTATRATRCTITGLTGGISYDVRVMAKTTAGNSGFSVPVTVTPLARPLAAAGRR